MPSSGSIRRAEPLRFAHPFFNRTLPGSLAARPHVGGRMTDFVSTKLGPVPPTRGNGRFKLSDIIGESGAAAIAKTGRVRIHLAGDTGVSAIDRETRQEMVAEAMARDYDVDHPENSPAFFLHLGDVIYGGNPKAYLDQFYRPYMHYPGKIVAIPGNHDGETAAKLQQFQDTFCTVTPKVPPMAGSIFRETMVQPGVYWCLDLPFAHIIGLYSNKAENPGYISGGAAGTRQKTWLVQTLRALLKERLKQGRKALFFATHHPPYSSGGHSGSSQMLAEIDDACQQANLWPDGFFSGHAHSIQRYTRTRGTGPNAREIPYLISGCGGHGQQVVQPAPGPDVPPARYVLGYKGWGYTTLEVSLESFALTSYGVDWDTKQNAVSRQIDTVKYAVI